MKFDFKDIRYEVPPEADKSKFFIWAASWGGAGFISPAPGTWGSLAGLLCGIVIYLFGGVVSLLIGVAAVTTLGLWAAQRYDEATGGHDSKMIVIDEVAGQWIAMAPAALNPFLLILSFLAFRLFDIWKPWPVSLFDEDIEGSAGVMGDDLVAGLMAAVIVLGVRYAFF